MGPGVQERLAWEESGLRIDNLKEVTITRKPHYLLYTHMILI